MMMCEKYEFIFMLQIKNRSMRDSRKFFCPSGENEAGFSKHLAFRGVEIIV
jgi:hypothetical protein